jgi:prepilin-type N-terminal cleavage/methylation domain-containing protein
MAMKMRLTTDRTKARAFSLLELLVAMVVLSVLIVLMLNMVDNATKLWRQTENSVDAYREARAAIGTMARDFQFATVGTNYSWIKFNLNSGAANTSFGSNAFFLTALPSNAQRQDSRSDICEVGYFLALDRTAASTNRTLNLYRYFRSSDQTYSNLQASTPFTAVATGATGEEIVARNIVGLSITPVSTNAVGAWTAGYTPTTNAPLPQMVEISLTAINQDLARKLQSTADWSDTNSALMKQATQTFTTRVFLQNKP